MSKHRIAREFHHVCRFPAMHWLRIVGIAGLTSAGIRSSEAADADLQYGLFPPYINGSAAYEFVGTFVFSIDREGSTDTIRIPLPDSTVSSGCGYEWRSTKPSLRTWVGRNTPVKHEGPWPSWPSRLRGGALYSFTPIGIPEGAESLFVEVKLSQTVAASVGSVPSMSKSMRVPEESFGTTSLVDFSNRALDDFDQLLDREYPWMGDYHEPDVRRLVAMVDWVRAHNEERRTRPGSSPRRSIEATLASTVVRDSVGDCFGFANLAQAFFARMNVPSRAVLVARPKFEVYGNTATGHGVALHVLVEYCTSCGWGLMDPQVADNFAPPSVRLACADEARYLLPTTDTGRFKYVRMTYDISRDKKKGSLSTFGGGRGRRPYHPKVTYYRQTDDTGAPCEKTCSWVKDKSGCRRVE